MKVFIKSIQFICLISVFFLLLENSFSINKENLLRYLGEDFSDVIRITFEFPPGCGNSYLTHKKISNDITKELSRRNLNIIEKLEVKNSSKAKLNSIIDPFFNIYLVKDNNKILLATTNPNSKLYSENLNNYPKRFIAFNRVPNDSDFSRKFEIVKVLQEKIIDNL